MLKKVGKYLYVCANHFTSDCFVNEGQYNAGFASKLLIKGGSIPTARDLTSHPAKVSICPSEALAVNAQLSAGKGGWEQQLICI